VIIDHTNALFYHIELYHNFPK